MHIAFFTDTFCPTVNGVVTSIVYYANELTNQGHQVLIIAPRNKEKRNVRWGLDRKVKTVLVPSFDGKVYPDVRIGLPTVQIWREIQAFHPDSIVTFTPLSVGINGLLIAKTLRIPVSAFYMTNYADEEVGKAAQQFPKLIVRGAQKSAGTMIKRLLNLHDLVFVPSSDTREVTMSMGVSKPIVVVPSPINVKRLQKAKKRGLLLRQQLGIEESLLYAGRLSGEKNLERLIEVFASIHASRPHCKLILIGDGPTRNDLFAYATSLHVNQSIVWFGAVPHTELVDQGYYYCGDLFISLSEVETQGLAMVEAMACGLFPVGVRARATKDLLEHVGLLVDPLAKTEVMSAAILHAIDQSDTEKATRSVELQKLAAQFDQTKCAIMLEKNLQTVLDNI